MPKILEDVRQRLIRETASQLRERGYGAVTVRSVAQACQIAIGTVYNYFPGKDDMIAACMLERWEPRLRAIRDSGAGTGEEALRVMHRELSAYAEEYAGLFADPAAQPGYAGVARRYHAVLRSQLAQPLERFCPEEFTAQFLAEAMLTWTLAGKSFEEIYSLLCRLL